MWGSDRPSASPDKELVMSDRALHETTELPTEELNIYLSYILEIEGLYGAVETLHRHGNLQRELIDIFVRLRDFVDSLDPAVRGDPTDYERLDEAERGQLRAADEAERARCRNWRCILSNGKCYNKDMNYPTALAACRRLATTSGASFKQPLPCGYC
jgi:hypothetical protein